MATTRKRARTTEGKFTPDDPTTPTVNEAYEPSTADLSLNVDSLAAFMGIEQPDCERLTLALDLAIEAAESVTGQPVGDTAPHGIRHGVHLLATELLIKDQLDDIPEPAAIPLVVRYLWQANHAGG